MDPTIDTKQDEIIFTFEGETHSEWEIEYPIMLQWTDDDGNAIFADPASSDRNTRIFFAFSEEYKRRQQAVGAIEAGKKSRKKTRSCSGRNMSGVTAIPDYTLNPISPAHRSAFSLSDTKRTGMAVVTSSAMDTVSKNSFMITDPNENIQLFGQICQDHRDSSVSTPDRGLLETLNGIIGTVVVKKLKDDPNTVYDDAVHIGVTVSISDLGNKLYKERRSKGKGFEQSEINAMVDRIKKLECYIGHIVSIDGHLEGTYPVLQWRGINYEYNTISFGSPFMGALAYKLITESRKLDAKGQQRLNKQGEPIYAPMYSALIKSEIASVRSRRSVEIVRIICNTIEMAIGSHNPSITAQGIIDQMPDFKSMLMNSSSGNRNLLLKRAFRQAFDLLRDKTFLTTVFPGIQLPDIVPTWGTLKTTKYYFTHHGIDRRAYNAIKKSS